MDLHSLDIEVTVCTQTSKLLKSHNKYILILRFYVQWSVVTLVMQSHSLLKTIAHKLSKFNKLWPLPIKDHIQDSLQDKSN